MDIKNHTAQEVIYHVVLLIETGFPTDNTKLAMQGSVMISKLSWQGHEFLSDIRDPEICRKAACVKFGASRPLNLPLRFCLFE